MAKSKGGPGSEKLVADSAPSNWFAKKGVPPSYLRRERRMRDLAFVPVLLGFALPRLDFAVTRVGRLRAAFLPAGARRAFGFAFRATFFPRATTFLPFGLATVFFLGFFRGLAEAFFLFGLEEDFFRARETACLAGFAETGGAGCVGTLMGMGWGGSGAVIIGSDGAGPSKTEVSAKSSSSSSNSDS